MDHFHFIKKEKQIAEAGEASPANPPSNPPAFLSLQVVGPQEMSAEEYQAMRQSNVDYLESKYDFLTAAGIQAIPGPSESFKAEELKRDFTGRVEYYLLSKGEQYKKENQPELAIACFRKANDLMPMYGDFYSRDYYMRLPRYLRQLRRFDEARDEEAKIQSLFGGNYRFIGERNWPEKKKADLLYSMEIQHTDLVEATYMRCCCSECAKHRGRVYCYSGKDPRFQKLPPNLLTPDHDCGITLQAFSLGINSLRIDDEKSIPGNDVQAIIKRSNRPFLDDRSEAERRDFDEVCRRKAADAEREIARSDFDWLWEFMPDICPKSFSAYMRMKNTKSDKYFAIVSTAKEKGREIT